MKINIKWDEPLPKANKKDVQQTYATNPNGSSRWFVRYNPEEKGQYRWFLYCMMPNISLSKFGRTFAEAEKNWLAEMQKHIDACQQLMADIKAGKNV